MEKNKKTQPTVGVETSSKMEIPEARIVSIQPPEMIHFAHCGSLARTTPTTAAGTVARPVMESNVTPEIDVDIYFAAIKKNTKNCNWQNI